MPVLWRAWSFCRRRLRAAAARRSRRCSFCAGCGRRFAAYPRPGCVAQRPASRSRGWWCVRCYPGVK